MRDFNLAEVDCSLPVYISFHYSPVPQMFIDTF